MELVCALAVFVLTLQVPVPVHVLSDRPQLKLATMQALRPLVPVTLTEPFGACPLSPVVTVTFTAEVVPASTAPDWTELMVVVVETFTVWFRTGDVLPL